MEKMPKNTLRVSLDVSMKTQKIPKLKLMKTSKRNQGKQARKFVSLGSLTAFREQQIESTYTC